MSRARSDVQTELAAARLALATARETAASYTLDTPAGTTSTTRQTIEDLQGQVDRLIRELVDFDDAAAGAPRGFMVGRF